MLLVVLNGWFRIAKASVNSAKISRGTAFPGFVTDFYGNGKIFLVRLNGPFTINKTSVGNAKPSLNTSLQSPVPGFFEHFNN